MTTTRKPADAISPADWIETTDGRTGKVAWLVDAAELFALMDDRPGGRPELVDVKQIARVIPAK
jgi:hypothetical protein